LLRPISSLLYPGRFKPSSTLTISPSLSLFLPMTLLLDFADRLPTSN
jgi:hypothetical protein